MIDYEYIGALKRKIEKMTPEELINKKNECEAKRSVYEREKNYHVKMSCRYGDYVMQEIILIDYIKQMMLNEEAGK